VSEDGLQLFQFQRRHNTEHALFAIKAAIRHEDVAVRIESEEVTESLNGNAGAGDKIILRNHLLEKDLQGLPGAAAEIGKKFSIIQEVTTKYLRNTEDEMPVGNLFKYIHVEPFSEFHHALLMTGWTEMAVLAGKSQQIFVIAGFTFDTGKAVVHIAASGKGNYHSLSYRGALCLCQRYL